MNPTTKLASSMAHPNPFLAAGSPFASSPFAPLTAPAEVPADAPEGSYTYALVKSAPEVPAAEVETAAPAVEITVRWGESVLHVAHLAPPRPFHVGDGESDFSLPAERLGGATRAPLVRVEGGVIHAVILPGATGAITFGAERVSVADAIASGRAAPSADMAGAHTLALPTGARASLALGDLSFEIAAVHAGKAVAGKVRVDRRSLPFTALSLAIHLGLLGAMAVFMPPMALADEEGISDEQRYALAQAIATQAEREAEASASEQAASGRAEPPTSSDGGAKAPGESGKRGSATSAARNGRHAEMGPKDNPEVRLSRAQWLSEAAKFGMVDLLASGAAGDPSASAARWDSVQAAGRDPLSALGNPWGDALGDVAGAGGLGLTGVGDGSDGKWMGVNLDGVGTIGRRGGLREGFGPSGQLAGGHKVASPTPRIGTPSVSGRIPADVIQRIVRQNFGRFRLCYEGGLRSSPSLAGRVSVGFIIGRDGAVSSVQNAGSDMPDAAVVSCVVRSFYGLSFPQPEGGVVKVTYPILFTPGG